MMGSFSSEDGRTPELVCYVRGRRVEEAELSGVAWKSEVWSS
jgi:hypothetical protein